MALPASSTITAGAVQRVLQSLLEERVSIRDLPSILEGISEACAFTRNIGAITEHVRGRLARQLSEAATTDAGFVPIVTLSPEWEQAFALYKGFDVEAGVRDLLSTLAHIRAMRECNGKVGAVGFCLGGKLAYLMATRSDVDVVIEVMGGADGLARGARDRGPSSRVAWRDDLRRSRRRPRS